MRWVEDMGGHEGGQRSHTEESMMHWPDNLIKDTAEFSGTLLGFDDYVSESLPPSSVSPPSVDAVCKTWSLRM